MISLYIAACYYALIGADTYTGMIAFRTLTEQPARLNALVEKSVVERVDVNRGTVNGFTRLKCGLLDVSSRPPSFHLVVLFGPLVFLLVFILIRYVVNSNWRGFFILFSFVIVCLLSGGLKNYLSGIGWYVSTTVLLTSFFYGALFWFIVSFSPSEFDEILKGAIGNTEKLRVMYDYTKFCWNVIGALFLGICITLAWNITGFFKQPEYVESGLSIQL